MLNLRVTPAEVGPNYLFFKRAFDIFNFLCLFSSLCGPLNSSQPLSLYALVLQEPILFEQERVGLNRKDLKMYKFRTMAVAASGESDTKWNGPE